MISVKASILLGVLLVLSGCISVRPDALRAVHGLSGTDFYREVRGLSQDQREALFLARFEQGHVPSFFFRFRPVRYRFQDATGREHRIVFYCSPDYAMIGQKDDWARVPLTPMAAQRLADRLDCFLPTPRLVDYIHRQSRVKIAPMPMYALRDSSITMWQHHLIIEGQRRGRQGLISGIKKDVVLCSLDALKGKADRVAIYGWHQLDGMPIQPLYTGHVNWYTDYSHGARMIYARIRVNRQWRHYAELLQDPLLRGALTDEAGVMLLRYEP